MPSKKEVILKLLDEGKSLDDLLALGYNKKYVQEIIRDVKKRSNGIISEKNSKTQYAGEDDIAHIKKDICEIKEFLKRNNWKCCKNIYGNKEKNNRQTLLDLTKVLELLKSNEQLINRISIEVEICIDDSKLESKINQEESDDIDIPNPIEMYRDKGKEALRDILHDYDIIVLKEIARRYTPDSRGYVYKWMDIERIINYIIERTESLSKKGNVFVTD